MSVRIIVTWKKGSAHIAIPLKDWVELDKGERENFAFNELTKQIQWEWKMEIAGGEGKIIDVGDEEMEEENQGSFVRAIKKGER